MISKVSVSRFAMSGACMALCAAVRAETMVLTNDLTTSWGRAVTPENVWREYPRPQLLVWDPTDTHLGGTGKQALKLKTTGTVPC